MLPMTLNFHQSVMATVLVSSYQYLLCGYKTSCPLQVQGDTGDARGLYQGGDPKRGGGSGGGRKSGASRMRMT